MIPQIFYLGPLPINSFGLLVALAFFAGVLSVQRSLARFGQDPEHAESLVFVAGVSGILGARLLHLIEIFDGFNKQLFMAAIAPAGFTFWGGFLLATACVWFTSKRKKISVPAVAGAAGSATALGYAIGRLGCQLSGDGDYGMATTSIFGMSYKTGVIPTPEGILAFPTPLYESAMAMAIAALLYKLEEKREWQSSPVAIFGLAVFLLSIERFLVEFLRINPRFVWNLSEAQIIACFLALFGLTLLIIKRPVISKKSQD